MSNDCRWPDSAIESSPKTTKKSSQSHTAKNWRHSCAVQSSSIFWHTPTDVYATLTLLLAWLLLFITSAGGRRNVRWKKYTKIYSSFSPSIWFSHSLPSSFLPTLKINISVRVFFFLLLLLEIITRCWYLFGSPQHCCCCYVRWVVTATSHHQVKGTCSASSMRILGPRACVGSTLGWTEKNTTKIRKRKIFLQAGFAGELN